jgi:DNA-binding helix-hairpin-helix protein with protein kinase domain
MATLKNGEMIPLSGSGQRARILSYIAEGGQGEVYKVAYNGGEYALKWYSKIVPSDAFYANLAHNIKAGAPDACFLWPQAITEKIKGRFGYIMRLRPSCYKEYGEFLLGEARFKSWDLLFKAALNIVESYFALHSMGYSYQDLNEGSFFINPDDGDVLICDNDNVAPFGKNLGVKGMPKYMAPEVVLNKSRPNTHTDRFSLAIILFRLFYIDHPLEGRYTIQFPLTDAIGAQLFGERPVFVYDPDNDLNRPDPEAHPNVIKRWPMFPPDLTAAFTKAFTKGLKDINSRITEQQWREVLIKARGMLVRINGKEQFVNAYKPETVPKECRLLRTEEQVIALMPDSVVYKCQVDRISTDYKTPAGLVKASTSNKAVYGLGNLTDQAWTCTLPGKSPVTVKPKAFAPLIPGATIDFGNIKGKVF